MAGTIFTKPHSDRAATHHEVFHDDEHVVRVLTEIRRREGRRGKAETTNCKKSSR
jgi:hypothetical protein